MPFVHYAELEDILDEHAAPLACHRIADAAGDKLVEHTKRFTPISKALEPSRPPGTARESVQRTTVRVTESVRGGRYTVTAFSDDPIFPFIEWNTKPHRITARPGHALRWVNHSGEHFAHSVWHPGTTGAHPFSLGAMQVESEIGLIAEEPLREFRRDLLGLGLWVSFRKSPTAARRAGRPTR